MNFFFYSSIPDLQCDVSFRWTAQWFNYPSMRALAKSLQSCPTLSVIPWTITHQAPLSMGFFFWRTLEWVAVPSTMRFSPPRKWTRVSCVSCIGRRLLYHQCHLGCPLYIHICLYILFQTLLCYKILQNVECGALCYTVGPYWLSVWCTEAHIC